MKYVFDNHYQDGGEVVYDLPMPFREAVQQELDEDIPVEEDVPIEEEEPLPQEEDYLYDPTEDDQFINQLVYGGYTKQDRFEAGNYYRQKEVATAAESMGILLPTEGVRTAPTASGTSISAQEAYQYYLGKGLQPHVAAGIVGNLQQESGLNTRAVGDNGTSKGLAQWRNDRWTGLVNQATRAGKNPHDPYFQLDYVLSEPGESTRALGKLNQTKSAEEAARVFGRTYERYNPAQANEAGRAQTARQLHQIPSGQFGLNILSSVVAPMAQQFLGNVLDNVFIPGKADMAGAQSGVEFLNNRGKKQQQALDLAKQQQDELYRYGQQGGSSFSQLKAYKPLTMGNQALSAGSAETYKQGQQQKYGFDYTPNQNNFFQAGIANYMKEQGNNVTGKAYTNQAALKGVVTPGQPTEKPGFQFQAPTGWIDSLFSGNLGLGVQAAAAVALNQESQQQRASEWQQLLDQPYRNIKTNTGITGAGLPAYAGQGYRSRYQMIRPE